MAARHQRAARSPHPARRAPHRTPLRGDRRHRGRAERRIRLTLVRVFPWDRSARDGEPFSPRYVPVPQGSGRFDLGDTPVWYLAESPEHAVAESLQAFRGRDFDDRMLLRFGHPLALVNVTVPESSATNIVNLDDGAGLARLGIAPSSLASDDRRRTQGIARTVFDSGASGMRWWSKLSGDWHTTILFLARVPVDSLILERPVPLTREHVAVGRACRHLGILLRDV